MESRFFDDREDRHYRVWALPPVGETHAGEQVLIRYHGSTDLLIRFAITQDGDLWELHPVAGPIIVPYGQSLDVEIRTFDGAFLRAYSWPPG